MCMGEGLALVRLGYRKHLEQERASPGHNTKGQCLWTLMLKKNPW